MFKFSENRLIDYFIENKYMTNLIMLLIIIAGLICLSRLNIRFFPSTRPHSITIVTEWSGANAKQIQEKLTRPIESAIQNLEEVKTFQSTSQTNFSFVKVNVPSNIDLQRALDSIKNAVSTIKNLPKASEPSQIKESKFSELVGTIVIGGQDLKRLRPIVNQLKRRLIDANIGTVVVNGLPKQEITISIDIASLHRLNLSLAQISHMIHQQDKTVPLGDIKGNEIDQTIAIDQALKTITELNNLTLPIPHSNKTVRLGDISHIHRTTKTNHVNIFKNNRAFVTIDLLLNKDVNILKSASRLKQITKQMQTTYHKTLNISLMYLYSDQVQSSISLLLNNAFSGLILVMLVIYMALNFKISLWIGNGLLLSIFGGLIILYAFGGSINLISITAFIIGTGIIVDDVVVVSEAFINHVNQNKPPLEAVKLATRQMFVPVLSSSLTTIAAFLPLILIGGVIGQVLRAIPLVVCAVIIASFFECFFIFPHHLYFSHRHNSQVHPSKFKQRLHYLGRHFRDTVFKPLVATVLHYRYSFIVFIICVLCLSFHLVSTGKVGFTFFSSPVYNRLGVGLSFKPGTPYETRRRYLHSIETTAIKLGQQLSHNNTSILKNAYTIMNKALYERDAKDTRLGNNYAYINIELVENQHRTMSIHTFIDKLMATITYPNYLQDISVSTYDIGPPGKDINLAITGGTLQTQKLAAEHIKRKLTAFQGVYNIRDDMPYGQEQIILKLKPQGRSIGLTETDVAQQLQAAFHGVVVKSYHQHLHEVEIRVSLPEQEKRALNTLDSFPIMRPQHKPVLLSQIASYHVAKAYSKINHENGYLATVVTAKVNPKHNTIANVLTQLKQSVIPTLIKQYHVKFDFGGRVVEQQETLRDMLTGLGLAIVLIYVILVWVFSSYTLPIVIFLALPLTSIGVILGHFILHYDISVISLFGLFGLVGISINDAIVLIKHYQELRHQDYGLRQAVVQSCCRRLRPVLLTSITTIMGLTPLLLNRSEDAKLLIPVAISITFGLVFSTILSLLVIPCGLFIHEQFLGANNGRKNCAV